MRVFLSLYLAQYMEAPDRLAKSEMIETVANTIRQSGGRFLKWSTDTHTYVPLNEKEVHRKCSHAFRDMVAARSSKQNQHQQQQQQQSLERRRPEEENESFTVGSPRQEQEQQPTPQKPARRPRSLVPFHFSPNTNNSSTFLRSRVASKQRRASASEVPDAAASPSTKKRPARRTVSWPNVHPPTEPFTHQYPPTGASSSRETQETRLQYLAPGPNANWSLEQLEPQQQEQHETDADLAEPNPKRSRSIVPSFHHPDSTATTAAVPSMDNMYNQPLSSTMGTATTTPTNMLSLSTSSTSEYNAMRNNLAFIPLFGGTEEEERLLFQDLFESDDDDKEEEDQMRQEWGNGGGGGLEDDMESL